MEISIGEAIAHTNPDAFRPQPFKEPSPPIPVEEPVREEQKLRNIILEYYTPYERYSPEAQAITKAIDQMRVQSWDEAEKNGFKITKTQFGQSVGVDCVPNLSDSIQNGLAETVDSQFPGYRNAKDDGFLSLRGFEWVTQEMALDELNRLLKLKDKGVLGAEEKIQVLTNYTPSALDETRSVLSKSNYISHATISTNDILDSGYLMSRNETKARSGKAITANTSSSLKDPNQEMDQISVDVDNVAMRYARQGALQGMRGIYFFPSLPFFLDRKTSYASADGIHLVNENGTAIPVENGTLVTTEEDYDRGNNGYAIKGDYFNPTDKHYEILTEEGKKRLSEVVLRDAYGDPVLLSVDQVEVNMAQMPKEITEMIKSKFGNLVEDHTREKIRKNAKILPTGHFVDGPGNHTKIFLRHIVLD